MAALSDAELWQRYVRERNEAAFEVCCVGTARWFWACGDPGQRTGRQDAFQATFLVLVLQGRHPVRHPRPWRAGLRSCPPDRPGSANRRCQHAGPKNAPSSRELLFDDPARRAWSRAGRELHLPEKYRTVLVLCDLEGKTRKEAARQLGWVEGTVASRLCGGRRLLAKRLARRGFGGVLVGAVLAEGSAVVLSLPPALLASTIRAVAANGVLSETAAALTEGVLRSMFLTSSKPIMAPLLISLATVGTGTLLSRSRATQAPGTPGSAPANPDDLHSQVEAVQKQLQHLQEKLTRLKERAYAAPAG